ncbi:MAG TPA: sugar phosphate isomerase/epimerase family protein [Chitinophaga sp.]
MKFALLTVTYGGLFYPGKALSLEEQIYKAKELGFDALSIETKRPVASPLDLRKKDRTRIKQLAADQGVPICAVESLSNFTGRFMEDRENNLAMMRMVLELAADLGVNIVKVFAAWPGIINDEEEIALYGPYERGHYYKRLYPEALRKWHHAVAGIREVADQAADMGITLALQNHAPVITPGYEDVLAMMEEVERDNVKLCLDLPLFYDRQGTDYIKEAVCKTAQHIILSHYGAWNFSETPDGKIVQDPAPSFGGLFNYETFIPALQQTGYDGYLVSEYCLPNIQRHQYGGIAEVDQATKITLQYMKDLLNGAGKASA